MSKQSQILMSAITLLSSDNYAIFFMMIFSILNSISSKILSLLGKTVLSSSDPFYILFIDASTSLIVLATSDTNESKAVFNGPIVWLKSSSMATSSKLMSSYMSF